jgi:hypothetical protein
MPLPLAHHTLVMAPLFAGPVVILAVALLIATRRDRRRQRGARDVGG